MGGVVKADQELTFYPVMRKQQKRYYEKTFRHLLEQCLWNACVLFVQHSDRQQSVEDADFSGWRPTVYWWNITPRKQTERQDDERRTSETLDV